MLSYQHQYHAGNFADVHKHISLRLIFEALLKKQKPFCYIDCHAGSGLYNLESDAAQTTDEFHSGIAQLWNNKAALKHASIQAYLETLKTLNPDSKLKYYPGSPKLAQQWLREQDRAQLLELHPQAFTDLKRHLRDERFGLHKRNCYEGLPALVPPEIKRGLVLLDPSYEEKHEYSNIVSLLTKAHKRWATATYAIWYPLLPANRHLQMIEEFQRQKFPKILISELTLHEQNEERGMYGSGMLIINSPWLMEQELEKVIPELVKVLAPETGSFKIQSFD